MSNQDLNKEKLWLIVMDLRPFEEIKIKKDKFGKADKIIVLTSCTTILDETTD